MKSVFYGLLAALVIHALIFLFGGVFFFTADEVEARKTVADVELFEEEAADAAEDVAAEDREPEIAPEVEVQPETEAPPDMKELYEAEAAPTEAPSATDSVARLDALSLSALEAALAGGGGAAGGDFAMAVGGLSSGGRIGGTGAPGSGSGADGGPGDSIFDVSDLDRGASPIFQAAPQYPMELRKQRVEGTVYVTFVVDTAGKVQSPRVERSPHPGFERPALDAVRQWRFEPAVRGGSKVASRMRVPIRFAAQS
jgi:protein TonB